MHHILLTHLLGDRQMGCFHPLAIENNAYMILLQVPV